MNTLSSNHKYVAFSLLLHAVVLVGLIVGFEFSQPLIVFENTNQHDVISAVILGESEKSKILPTPVAPPKPPEEAHELPPLKPLIKPATVKSEDAIALKALPKKPSIDNQQAEKLAKNLLADIQKQALQKKQLQKKQLQNQFEKLLKEQAEQSLRQQLLKEDLQIAAKESRQAQGQVDKYKALILQAISSHWLLPRKVDKNLSAELMIRLAPGGMVLDVTITKSSGDPTLDSSVRAAVLKSSPLPVPKEQKAFAPFKQFVLKVKPKDMLNQAMLSGEN